MQIFKDEDNWIINFILNILGYGAVVVPASLVVRFLKNSDSIKNGKTIINLISTYIFISHLTGSGLGYSILRAFVLGSPKDEMQRMEEGESKQSMQNNEVVTPTSTTWYLIKLLLCIVGLQLSYLTWGLLQVIYLIYIIYIIMLW